MMGVFTGVYALFAHDARWDPIGHITHHRYVNCTYGLWGIMDKLCNTEFSKEKFPIEYVPTWKRKND